MATRFVLLVHGGWGGAWSWDKVVPGLVGRGIEVGTVDLPLTSLADDATAVRGALDDASQPKVVCGHSYGGAVITAGAAGHANAAHLVYLCAFMPDAGETVVDITTWGPPGSFGDAHGVRVDSDGTCTVSPEVAIAAAYHDCDPGDAAAATARFRPHHMSSFVTPIETAAWRDVPSTYVLGEQDRSIDPAIQRKLASRATNTVAFPTGHAPQLARPDLLVDLLARLATEDSPVQIS